MTIIFSSTQRSCLTGQSHNLPVPSPLTDILLGSGHGIGGSFSRYPRASSSAPVRLSRFATSWRWRTGSGALRRRLHHQYLLLTGARGALRCGRFRRQDDRPPARFDRLQYLRLRKATSEGDWSHSRQ